MRVLLFIFLSLFGSQVLSSESRGELLAKLESCGEVLEPLKRLGCFEQILEEEYAKKAGNPERIQVTVCRDRFGFESISKLVSLCVIESLRFGDLPNVGVYRLAKRHVDDFSFNRNAR